ncbi:MAG: hypothetical protein R3B72_25120 [Polyangiaceae bacterium]
MAWQYHDFIRMICVGGSRAEVLESLRNRLERLQNRGFIIPQDATVTLRQSQDVGVAQATAQLVLPESARRGKSFILRRHRHDVPRTVSGTQPIVHPDDVPAAEELPQLAVGAGGRDTIPPDE